MKSIPKMKEKNLHRLDLINFMWLSDLSFSAMPRL